MNEKMNKSLWPILGIFLQHLCRHGFLHRARQAGKSNTSLNKGLKKVQPSLMAFARSRWYAVAIDKKTRCFTVHTVEMINFIIMCLFFACYVYQFVYIPIAWLPRKRETLHAPMHRFAVLDRSAQRGGRHRQAYRQHKGAELSRQAREDIRRGGQLHGCNCRSRAQPRCGGI